MMKTVSMISNSYKIPPVLPFLKGGTPLFIKEGAGEIFRLWRFFLVAGLFVLTGCMSVRPNEQAVVAHPSTPADAAGIKIERIHPSAGGQMLDMRYSVVNKEKARGAIKRGAQIYLIDQSSGTKLPVPDMAKVGK